MKHRRCLSADESCDGRSDSNPESGSFSPSQPVVRSRRFDRAASELLTPSCENAHVQASAVLLLGDPRLRVVSRPVTDFEHPDLSSSCQALSATLAGFRRRHGFGRAISAPQIGVPLRLIAVNLGDGPFFVFNPIVIDASGETFTMWDDCMSFPGLLVRLARDRSISLQYSDERGSSKRWDRLGLAESELLQHEIDHLDGVLAIDRALDRDSIVMREVFEATPERFRAMADYVIQPVRG